MGSGERRKWHIASDVRAERGEGGHMGAQGGMDERVKGILMQLSTLCQGTNEPTPLSKTTS